MLKGINGLTVERASRPFVSKHEILLVVIGSPDELARLKLGSSTGETPVPPILEPPTIAYFSSEFESVGPVVGR